ncbi:hypothetical protein B0T22DRAFT_71806 [Podospora appendiculata]|uniref:Threonine/serine exporter-like N-terminal domain-containing protein n=1 Tax=Podospora appendiculata TaxID=314037 RepID=A0AAE1CH57_9PEZI|nr:hypothetical protein B0T22DRAFT_71806 [Podospora appendiculata]
MASPQTPPDPHESGSKGQEHEEEHQPDLGKEQQNNDETRLPEPKGKEKKRVGFLADKQRESLQETDDADGASDVYYEGPSQLTPQEQQYGSHDYFSSNDGTGTGSTPLGPAAQRESFNRDELTAALTQILKPEDHSGPAQPSRPRPVLRRQTFLDGPSEQLNPPHRSEVEAKNRADRLAFAVGNSSVSGSRKNSFEMSESGLENDDAVFLDQSLLTGPGRNTAEGNNNPGFQLEDNSTGLRARKGAQQTASDLVRSHTRRRSPLVQPFFSMPQSGNATPIPDDVEYVPRPEKFKGGILGSLLKLYNADEKTGGTGTDSSVQTTPNRTPNWTPSSSPPVSRPTTPQPRKIRPGLQGLRSNSASTLAGLMESSFMFAAPGSNGVTEAVSEKLRSEKERPKKRSRSKQKLEQFRITKHIAEIISRHQYLIKLCNALMMYGAPTHRLEAYMKMSARVLAIDGQFMYLPGTMIISFDDSNTHTTEVKIVRQNQGVDLGRLRDVHEIYKQVVHDLIGVEEATSRLNEVVARGDKFSTWLRVLLFGVASASVAPFGFEGRYIDLPVAFGLGCMVGYLQLFLAPSNELYANVFEITAAVATSFLSRVFGSIQDGKLFCFSALAQSSIALILPGYMVLCASLELQSHQMISGSVRMVYALIYSLFLGYGITIGSVIYGYIDRNAVSDVHCSVGTEWYTQKPDQNFYILFVLPFTLCLCAINQAKWKQTPIMVCISLAGYLVNNFSSRYFSGNSTLSSTLGALCIGVLANLYSRLGRPVENFILDKWEHHLSPRLRRLTRKSRRPFYYESSTAYSSDDTYPKDPELGRTPSTVPMIRHARSIGYGLAAAAMLPAIFVQVPSGLAVGGSLLSGVTSADQITRNETLAANGTFVNGTSSTSATDLNSTAFNVLFSVVQVAISASVGLSLSALIVYPFGKRRSGLASF